jgi:hypothetical protein
VRSRRAIRSITFGRFTPYGGSATIPLASRRLAATRTAAASAALARCDTDNQSPPSKYFMNTFEEQSQDDALRNKLNSHEFKLPPLAWDNMQSRLDDMTSADADADLRQKVSMHELAPPAFAWDKMQNLLDHAQPPNADELLRQKVAQQQFALPAFAWETMQTALDQTTADQQLQQATADYQFVMPADAWANMQSKLDALEDKKRRRKIIAAWCWRAAFVGLLLGSTATILWYANSDKPTDETPSEHKANIANHHNNSNANANIANANVANLMQINVFDVISSSFIKSATLFNNNSTQQPTNTNTRRTNIGTTQVLASTNAASSNSANPSDNNIDNSQNNSIVAVENNPNNTLADNSNNTKSIDNIENKYLDLPTIALAAKQEPNLNTDPIALGKSVQSPFKGSIWVGVNAKLLEKANVVSVTPVVGIGTTYQLNAHHKLMAGVQFKQILTQGGAFVPNIAPMVLNENPTERAENFMATTSDTPTPDIYQLQKMNLIEIPLGYHYQISRKHAVQIGTKLGIVAGVRSKRMKPQEMPTTHLNRHDVGIGLLNMGATLAYEHRINKNWSLNIQYTAGFSNLMYSAQQKYKPYASFWDTEANKGNVFLLIADNKPAPPVLVEAPEKMFNNDLMLSLRFNF